MMTIPGPASIRASLSLILMLALSTTAAQEVDSEGLAKCRAISNPEARIECYDRLAETVAAEPATSHTPPENPDVAETPAPSDVVDIDDSVGREAMAPREKDRVEFRAHIDSCYKTDRDKYIFEFDNGQIWKQRNNVRLTWKECDFDVTLRKDVFGYVMQPVGEKRKVRVSRVR